jgi:hypothetical protein
MPAKGLTRLVEALAVRSPLIVRIAELERVVLPPAHETNLVASRPLLVSRVQTAAGAYILAYRAILPHPAVRGHRLPELTVSAYLLVQPLNLGVPVFRLLPPFPLLFAHTQLSRDLLPVLVREWSNIPG